MQIPDKLTGGSADDIAECIHLDFSRDPLIDIPEAHRPRRIPGYPLSLLQLSIYPGVIDILTYIPAIMATYKTWRGAPSVPRPKGLITREHDSISIACARRAGWLSYG